MSEETNQLTDMNSECGSSEPYALQVTDNSMEPEFPKDCIVIVDPSGSCVDGQYIFVEYEARGRLIAGLDILARAWL